MMMRASVTIVILALIAAIAVAEVEIARATREIDVSGALARDQTLLTFKNPPATITVAYASAHVAFITAKQDQTDLIVSSSPLLKEVDGKT